jgi:hypothetical protein
MAVPETTMHKDNRTVFGEDKIWSTGKVFVQPKSKT